ncbi:hypothetical protein L1987_59583 [Smallanthus sonchifolius]|uniref:Uncharacterized protein n=1 Tax=Smallanthus sonchifolius TaxID=185202 RepID=A0ACB9D5P0_9ASTR|nr:hypothetical protein L1987_59583 [Smallanthus sonchifolius]
MDKGEERAKMGSCDRDLGCKCLVWVRFDPGLGVVLMIGASGWTTIPLFGSGVQLILDRIGLELRSVNSGIDIGKSRERYRYHQKTCNNSARNRSGGKREAPIGANAWSGMGASACSRSGSRRKYDAIDYAVCKTGFMPSSLNKKELIVRAATLGDRGD